MQCLSSVLNPTCATQKKSSYALQDNLPIGTPRQPQIERITYNDLGKPIHAEFLQGSTKSAPDVALDWILNEPRRAGEHDKPLTEDPSDTRKALFRFCLGWATMQAVEFEACFGLRDPESQEMVAVAVCYPPSEDPPKLYRSGMWKFLQMLVGFMLQGKQFPENVNEKRKDALFAAVNGMQDACAPKPHWYIQHLATLPNLQGEGFGRRLMQFVARLADADQVPTLLEASGERQHHFFEGLGFKAVQAATPSVGTGNNPTLDMGGGVKAMVRAPMPKRVQPPTPRDKALRKLTDEQFWAALDMPSEVDNNVSAMLSR